MGLRPQSRRIYSRADLDANDFQPRFSIWLRVTTGGTAFDYMNWINRHRPRYLAETGLARVVDHDAFDRWLEANAVEHAPLTEAEIDGLRGVLAEALASQAHGLKSAHGAQDTNGERQNAE